MTDCLFCNIAQGRLQADIVYQTDELIAFRDRYPVAPTHVLIIPKVHIATINETSTEHEALLGKMILAAQHIAVEQTIHENGYRLLFNVNHDGGQQIYHIHLHLLGGRPLTWPPG